MKNTNGRKRTRSIHTYALFPTILASLSTKNNSFSRSILKQHLHKLQQTLNKAQAQPILNDSLLSLFPALIQTSKTHPSISSLTCQIIGSAALSSFEMNESISVDSEILRSLVECLSCGVEELRLAACNAIMDLSTTVVGRRGFCGVYAVEKMMSVFLQEAVSPSKFLFSSSSDSKIGVTEAEFAVSVFESTLTLINACNMEQMAKFPLKLSTIFLSYLKELWASVRDQGLSRNPVRWSNDKNGNIKCIKIHGLEESIFRLCTNLDVSTVHCNPELVQKSFFGPNEGDFEHFMLSNWEDSPLTTNLPRNDHDDIFSSYIGSLGIKSTSDVMISSILRGLVSCPPLPSDELDLINFLDEANGQLGCPMIYGQDIRVLKTVEDISESREKREVHFLNAYVHGKNDYDMINVGVLKNFIEAFQEGYTIALRGMELRSEKIASIADGLGMLFGQPSVGVNAYLTPPGSQGLARHYDDHCVFVCQILGNKRWIVLPRPTSYLPRLYEPIDTLLGTEGETNVSDCRHILLKEGEMLYIPRGCPHEACTTEVDDNAELEDGSADFSLHLTFGIEVEPPFEWEGFAHVALRHWNRKHYLAQQLETCKNSLKETLHNFSLNLLHVDIQRIGSKDPIFRKACLVAAFSRGKIQGDFLFRDQKSTFKYVIDKINSETIFSEAFKRAEIAIQQKSEDLFYRLKWLRHLPYAGDIDWKDPLTGFQNLFLSCMEYQEDAERVFMQMQSKFCKELIFDDICESFKALVHQYKTVRTQYKNGMLSLHHKMRVNDG